MNVNNYLTTKVVVDSDLVVKEEGMNAKVEDFAGDIINLVLVAAIDPHKPLHPTQKEAVDLLWPMILKMQENDTRAPSIGLYNLDTSEQLNLIIKGVSEGKLDFNQAQKYLELIEKKSEVGEMKELMDMLDSAEQNDI